MSFSDYVANLTRIYPTGARVLLQKMKPNPLVPDDEKGTIIHVNKCDMIYTRFDNGTITWICPQTDQFQIIEE